MTCSLLAFSSMWSCITVGWSMLLLQRNYSTALEVTGSELISSK